MRTLAAAAAAVIILCLPSPARAYSVLAHEAVVDAAWDDVIVPLLRQRFPRATTEEIAKSRAFAYGGSVIPDLGYYPFGNKLFTNLTHYVRSGDFVEGLLQGARDVNELAFALGAAAHYVSDNIGHPVGVNRAVPLIYPKVQRRFGNEVIYADDPKRHVMTEFAFDVVQTATGTYLPDAHRAHIGFEVALPLVERVFRATYNIDMRDLFASEDMAIGTFRYAVSQLIPEMTRVAWKQHQDEIRKIAPTVQPNAFIYTFTRRQYEEAFGTMYRRPGFFARLLGVLVRILPKVGPLSTLAFKVPTPEAEKLFAESFRQTRDRYRLLVAGARNGRVQLANTDFDIGQPAKWGENAVADDTYLDLLERFSKNNFVDVPDALRRDITQFFSVSGTASPFSTAFLQAAQCSHTSSKPNTARHAHDDSGCARARP